MVISLLVWFRGFHFGFVLVFFLGGGCWGWQGIVFQENQCLIFQLASCQGLIFTFSSQTAGKLLSFFSTIQNAIYFSCANFYFSNIKFRYKGYFILKHFQWHQVLQSLKCSLSPCFSHSIYLDVLFFYKN